MKKIQDRHLFIEIKKRFWPDDMNLLDVEGLDYLREKIFTLSFKILAFVATPMFFLLMIKMIMEKNYLSAAVDGLFIITYVLLLAIKSIPQKTKDIIMVLSVYAIGFVFIFQFNAEGSGLMVMLSTIVFTGFMMAKKTAIRLVLITLLVNLSLTLFVFAGHLETLTIALNKEIWLTNLLVLYAYGLGIFSLVSFLIAGLNKQAKQIREANKLVAASQKRYQAMIRNIEDVIMVVDSLGIAKYISPNVREIYGWQDEEVLNRPLLEKIYEDDRDKAIKIFRNVLNGTKQKERLEIRHASKNGDIKNLEICLTDLRHDPLISGILINFHDITQRRAFEEKIMHMNYHDDLTGLYNRTYFNKIKAEIDCEDHLPLSLIAADIDGLKFINDSFGHLEGDEILKLAGQLFKRTFRKEDIITRTGGDEFVIFLPRTSQKDSHRLIDRLNAEKKRYNQKNNQKAHYLSISLGVATKTRPDQDFNELLKKADYQMYEQKNRKKKDLNKHLIFSMKKALFNKLPDLEEATKRWAKIAREIGAAIGLSDDQLKQVDRLTILGELGKITIDEQILAKRGELSDQEKKDYYKHPELAGRIAKAIPAWKSLAPAILALGENWDGSGYPEGLSGEAIPLLSRILALAKFFDQLDQEESGQKRRKSDQIAELKKVSGSRFDPRLVKVLINLLQEEGRS